LPEERNHINDFIFLHPKYAKMTISEIKNDKSRFVFSIDSSDGVGGDYSILNIYKASVLPLNELLKKKDSVRGEIDTVTLIQIGFIRTNEHDINQFAAMCEYVIYDIFNYENTTVCLEMNHKGEVIHNIFQENDNYWPGQMLHTKHTEMATRPKLGLRLGPINKIRYCEKFKYLINLNKIIPTEYITVMELMSFGKTKGGSYRGQGGNDDLAITSVNLSPLFDTQQFWEIAIYTYENSPIEYQETIKKEIFDVYLKPESNKSLYNFDSIKEINSMLNQKQNSSDTSNMLSIDNIKEIKKINSIFFNSNQK